MRLAVFRNCRNTARNTLNKVWESEHRVETNHLAKAREQVLVVMANVLIGPLVLFLVSFWESAARFAGSRY